MELEKRIDMRCSECGGQVIYVNGEYVCTRCGLVISEEKISMNPEWKPAEDDKRSRVGPPLTNMLPSMGISTTVGKTFTDNLSENQIKSMFNMKILADSITKGNNRTLYKAASAIQYICDSLNLPKQVREEAMKIFVKSHERDLIKGRIVDIFALASVYLACRIMGVGKTLKDISQVNVGGRKVDRFKLYEYVKLITEGLGIKVNAISIEQLIHVIAAKVYNGVDCFEKKLETIRNAEEILSKLPKEFFFGKDPNGIAAAIVYLASLKSGVTITQKEVARHAGVTEVTVRKRSREIGRILS